MRNTSCGAARGQRGAGEGAKESAAWALDERMATRRRGGGLAVNGVEESGGGVSFETLRQREKRPQSSMSVPRRNASMIDAVPPTSFQDVAIDGSRRMYSDVYRDKLSARIGPICQNDDDTRSGYRNDGARFREDSKKYSSSSSGHYALQFTAGSERSGQVSTRVQRTPLKSSLKTECSRKADGGYSSHGKTVVPDDGWLCGGRGENGPGVHDNESATYYDSTFATTKAEEGWGVSETNNPVV